MTVPDIHRSVLENLLDGVLVVSAAGRVETLNPAAERILGLEPGEAVGRSFAELFIAREGFDDLSQLMLDATAQRSDPGRRVVEIRRDGEPRSLSVATSYLNREAEGGGSAPAAVIAVFSDITELRELRETELRLAKAGEEQHGKLQTAYREIEDRNEALAAALRKVRVAQGLGIALVFGLFLGVGLWTWRPFDVSPKLFAGLALLGGETEAVSAAGDGAPDLRTVTVKPRRNSTSLTLKGRLSPWREQEVKSPVEGAIAAVKFEIGEKVSRGQVLLELDLSKLQRRYQGRVLAFRKAEEALEKLRSWEESPEMIRARREFSKSRMDMDSRRGKMSKSRFLFDKGLIAAAEFADAEREYQSQLLDFETAREEFEATRARADGKALAAAKLNLEKARAEMLAARAEIEENAVRAPFAGTVLAPTRQGNDLAVGAKVRKGQTLFRIGDFTRIAATATADEIDVIKLKAGQKVTVTGNAFPGLRLRGVVKSVAAEADPRQKRKPVYHVSFVLDKLRREELARLRAGMTARLRIVTYNNPKALLVPIGAVRPRRGKHWLRVLDPRSGEVRERVVTIGPTTRSKVEIASGLKAGERVVLAGG